MGVIRRLREAEDLNETDRMIRNFILEYPEKIKKMTIRSLAAELYISTASIVRFTQKLDYKGFSDFKMQLLEELKADVPPQEDTREIRRKDSLASIVNSLASIEKKILDDTRRDISYEQLARVIRFFEECRYVDFYATDFNISIANYGENQMFHAGKIANLFSSVNIQQLMSLNQQEGHLAVIISSTGENRLLREVARNLKRTKTKSILITAAEKSSLAGICDETLLATSSFQVEKYKTVMFSASAKYLIDIIFCCLFSKHFDAVMGLNEAYQSVRKDNMWYILDENPEGEKRKKYNNRSRFQ